MDGPRCVTYNVLLGSWDVWQSVTEGGGQNWPKIAWRTLWTAPKCKLTFPTSKMLNVKQWRAEGGADGATTPGIHPIGGIQRPSFRKKVQVIAFKMVVRNFSRWKASNGPVFVSSEIFRRRIGKVWGGSRKFWLMTETNRQKCWAMNRFFCFQKSERFSENADFLEDKRRFRNFPCPGIQEPRWPRHPRTSARHWCEEAMTMFAKLLRTVPTGHSSFLFSFCDRLAWCALT